MQEDHPSLKKGMRDSKTGRKFKNSGFYNIMMISSRACPSHFFKSNYWSFPSTPSFFLHPLLKIDIGSLCSIFFREKSLMCLCAAHLLVRDWSHASGTWDTSSLFRKTIIYFRFVLKIGNLFSKVLSFFIYFFFRKNHRCQFLASCPNEPLKVHKNCYAHIYVY